MQLQQFFFFKEIFLSNRFQSPISTRSQRREIVKDSAYIFQKSLSLNYAEMCSLNAVGEEKGICEGDRKTGCLPLLLSNLSLLTLLGIRIF